MSKYTLQKDLPTLKAGEDVIFEKGDDVTRPYSKEYSYCKDGRRWYLSPLDVENNKRWFKKIKPEEEVQRIEVRMVMLGDTPMQDGFNDSYSFVVKKRIEKNKFPAIKEAIESVLNGEFIFNQQELIDAYWKLKNKYEPPSPAPSTIEGGKDKGWEIISLKHRGSKSIVEGKLVKGLADFKDYNGITTYEIN